MSLCTRGLEKSYGALRAVAGVSFEIPAGQIVGLIGPNGSGKSTILRILATFLVPDRGTALVAGFDCLEHPRLARRALGYLPESLPGYVDARVVEYLDYRASLKQVPRRERRAEVDRCLDTCRLTTMRRRLIGRLSHGYRRRVGLADALLGSPAVLLLDEPTVGLDPLQVRETRELLASLAPRTTILLSTHLLPEAESLCARALVLVHGQLVSDVLLAELAAGSGFEIELSGVGPDCAATLGRFPGVQAVELRSAGGGRCEFRVSGTADNLRERVVRECVAQGWGVRSVRSLSASLEDHLARVAPAPAPRREAA